MHPPRGPQGAVPSLLQFTIRSTSSSFCDMSSRSRDWHLYVPLLLLFTSCRFRTPLSGSTSDDRSCHSSSCRQGAQSRVLSPTQAPSHAATAPPPGQEMFAKGEVSRSPPASRFS